MSLSPSVLDAMVSAGCTTEQIVAAVKAAIEEQDILKAAKRDGNAARQRRKRETDKAVSRDVTHVTRDERDSPLSPKETSPTPPKEITPIPTTPSTPKGVSPPPGFDLFWGLFPNKVGKGDAMKAFVKALTKAPLETIIAGERRYAAKTDDRPWCNPATFLNQERWADEPPAPVLALARAGPYRPPHISHLFATVPFTEDHHADRPEPADSFGTVLQLSAPPRSGNAGGR